jgi:hypothetical protein
VNQTVHIPDDLAARLSAAGGDLSRRALEALAAEEYKHDRLTKPELQRLIEDAERERKGLHRLGY